MIQTAFKTTIGLFALIILSACATVEKPEPQAAEGLQCHRSETLTCDRFADENYNCTCEKGDNIRDMLDAYSTPDF